MYQEYLHVLLIILTTVYMHDFYFLTIIIIIDSVSTTIPTVIMTQTPSVDSTEPSKHINTYMIAAFCVICVILGILLCIAIIYIFLRRQGRKPNTRTREERDLLQQSSASSSRSHTTSSSGMKWLTVTDSYLPDTCNVEFIRSVQVIPCDHSGGQYRYPGHSINIRIPRDAVTGNIDLSVGVVVHGPFEFPHNMRPISAILWLHVQDMEFQFLKKIEIQLPHYLKLFKEDSALRNSEQKLGWMIATTNGNSEMMAFEMQDSASVHFYQANAKIWTNRTCYMCLCASKSIIEAKKQFFLVSAIPKPVSLKKSVLFFVVYSLDTFVEVRSFILWFINVYYYLCGYNYTDGERENWEFV